MERSLVEGVPSHGREGGREERSAERGPKERLAGMVPQKHLRRGAMQRSLEGFPWKSL